MKTAISVEDRLMKEADRYAHRLGLSRSRLVSLALRDYLRRGKQEEILERLNQVYADESATGDAALARRMKVKFSRVIKDRW
jgi:metal-responsive CopG/Arc/MetJ family transcriptional regulator